MTDRLVAYEGQRDGVDRGLTDDGRRLWRLSQSKLKQVDTCPERGRRTMLNLMPDGATDSTASGRAVHEAIELCLRDVIDGQGPWSLPDMIEVACIAFNEEMALPSSRWVKAKTAPTVHGQMARCLNTWYQRVLPTLRPLAVEVNFGPLVIHEDEHRVIEVVGQIDYVDEAGLADWKGLATDTRIPTPWGWTTIGDLTIGDVIYGSNGQWTTVTAKSKTHMRRCYRVTFDDASSIVTDDVHLWTTDKGVVPTPELTHLHYVKNANPIQAPYVELPMNPYLLGAWLGDGHSACAQITIGTKDQEHFKAAFDAAGFPLSDRAKTITFAIGGGFSGLLSEMGLRGNKHVPDAYLRASDGQRLSLLQGLMDTDGNWNAARNQACFDSTNRRLADAVYELVVSLGWRASIYDGQPTMPNARPYRRITFTPFGVAPFRLGRKADAVRMDGTPNCRRRRVVSVDKTLTVPTQCIQVAAADSLFLCGDQMVPTHNTTGRDWVEWEHKRWDLQPTMYTWAYGSQGETPWTTRPDAVTPASWVWHVLNVNGDYQRIETTRGPADWAWLTERCLTVAQTLEADLPAWPKNDGSALCSPKYCAAWDDCKGAHMGPDWPVSQPVTLRRLDGNQ